MEARKRKNKQKGSEEGKAGEQDGFIRRPTFDVIGRELIALVVATLREISKQEIESPTKADENMLLPLGSALAK